MDSGLTDAEESELRAIIADIDKFDWKAAEKARDESKAAFDASLFAFNQVADATAAGQAKVSGVAGTNIADFYVWLFLTPGLQKAENRLNYDEERYHFLVVGNYLPLISRYSLVKMLLVSKKPEKARSILHEVLSRDPAQAKDSSVLFLAGLAAAADDAAFVEKVRAAGGDIEYLKDVHKHRAEFNLKDPQFLGTAD